MRTSGGRGAGSVLAICLPALLVLSLAGCTEEADRAHVLQTHIGRIEHVDSVDVTTASRDRGTVIAVRFDAGAVDRAPALTTLIADVDAAVDDEGYSTYRLDLTPDSGAAKLVVDDSFAGRDDETAVLTNWYAVRDALLGDLEYVVVPGVETITVDSGGAIAHDVSEAGHLHYGSAGTTWTFVNADTSFTVAGAVGFDDSSLFQDVQRSVSSESLQASAPGWRLDRRDGHVRLDLDVEFDGQPVPPAELTIARYGADVSALARAAIGAARVAGLPVWLDLHNDDGSGAFDDDFASWVTGQAPAKGRDPLDRGWDVWLAGLAKASAGG
ncbi:hypothetical protein ABLE68_09080 [Nocardioides sp. CN2-186]|uniref:hypothetical protein n=1 Tax=Nocardioides tweenelious TaxID=3156607 RepID=UPI0032B33346